MTEIDAAAQRPTPEPDQRLEHRLATRIVSLRWLWLLVAAAIAVTSFAGASRLSFDPSARIFFDEQNPDRLALDAFERSFAKDDNLMFVLAPEGGDVFTPRVLALQARLTECLWRFPFVRRVNSLTNFQHTYADGDELIVRDLLPVIESVDPYPDQVCDLNLDVAAVTPEMAAEARLIAMDRVELRDGAVATDGDVAQVQVLFTLPDLDPANEVPIIAAEAQRLAAQVEAAFPDIDVAMSGGIMINNQFAVSGQQDGAVLTPLMFSAILLLVFVILRSVFATLAVVVMIAISSLAGLGALGWSGVSINSVTVLSYLYISTLAVASAVHVLASARKTMVDTPDRKEWARRALTEHMGAITIAAVTTAIGFFSLNFSISPPFRQLGNIVGFGVLVACFLTLTLLPALITFLPIGRRTERAAADRWMAALGEFVVAKRRILLPGMALAFIACVIGIRQLALEDDFIRYFDERYEFRQDTDFIEANLTGVNLLEWPLNSGESEGVNDPEFLRQVSGFVDWLREHPQVTYVRSATDTIVRLNMNMNADDPAFFRLPETREEASQYLFLYELSMNYGMDLTDQINVDKSVMRVSVSLANVTTADMRAFTDEARGWLRENAPTLDTAPTGIVHVFNLISYRDVRAMLLGSVVALVLISVVLLIVLRDVKIGIVSLVPNLAPAAMAFGIWGYAVGEVTLALAVVLAATLGIVVDDTVHFLSKYVKARRAGRSPEDSVRYTFQTVGMALFTTTLALMAGFLVLAQSGFAVNGDLAKLTGITIVLALAADFFLLPPLLIWIDNMLDARRTTLSPRQAAVSAVAFLAVLAMAAPALAETPAEKGLRIAQENDAQDFGWGDVTADGEMVLRDAQGTETRRTFQFLNLENPDPDGGDYSITVFSSPRDIRGTGLLSHANLEPQDDDQWLYLPAVKRVKRISSSNRTGKFVSSEFSFEDLAAIEVADDDHLWLRDEPCPGAEQLTCYVTESRPKNPRSGYQKRINWVDQDEYREWQVEYYNRRGDLEKTLNFSGYEQYLDRYWRAGQLSMVNHQTGKSTDLLFSNYQFQTGLSDGDFNAQVLPRMAR